MTTQKKYVLQLCHDYAMPFLDIARQYASLFDETEFHVITVYLVGKEDDDVITKSASEHVIFLNNKSADLRGLKRKQIKQLKQICNQYDFKFAIAHRYKPIYILGHIKELPVIGVNHAFGVYQRFMRRYFVNRRHKNLYLLGVSNAIRDEIRKELPKFPQQHIQTLYNRINASKVKRQQLNAFAAKEFLGIPKDKYVFASVGRLHRDKDQKTLISAFALTADKCPGAILVIIGHGELENDLRHQAKTLKLEDRIFLLGAIPNAVHYFRAFDTFVLTSIRESFGMVLLEAIVSRLPILSTKTGGAKEIICNHQNLFDIGDIAHLAEMMHSNYSLDGPQRTILTSQNTHWLEHNFTDEVVKSNFWSLPFVQKIRNEDSP